VESLQAVEARVMATENPPLALGDFTTRSRSPVSADGEFSAVRPGRFERAVVVLALVTMLVGIVWRFVGLESKLYNNDEATTSVHVSGKTIDAYARTMFDGRPRSRDDVLSFQRPDPAHGPRDLIASLAIEDPQHPPLYYLAQYGWERAFGSSIAMHRAPAAIFGALAVLAAAWLAAELWSTLAGLLCGALVAASPFALLYSQEAREYTLWLLLTCVASALLVRAARAPTLFAFALYALACVLGCYTDLLFLLVLVAHAISLPWLARGRKVVAIGALVSVAAALAAYVPWLIVSANAYGRGVVTNNTYLAVGLSPKLFVLKWLFNVGALFYDLDYLVPKSAVLIVPGLIALAWSLWSVARRVPARPELAVLLSLGAVTAVALLSPDLAHHEARSTAARYLVPLWAALYSILGIALAIGLRGRPSVAALSAAFLALSVVLGFGSFAVSHRYESWWIDGSVRPIGPIVRALDAGPPQATLLYHATWSGEHEAGGQWDFSVMLVADELRRDVSIVQYARGASVLPAAYSAKRTTFVLDPTDALRDSLRAAGVRLERADDAGSSGAPAELASMRTSAAALRATHGFVDFAPSLWKVCPNRRSHGAALRCAAPLFWNRRQSVVRPLHPRSVVDGNIAKARFEQS
jgi:uncharacterized membrane protein